MFERCQLGHILTPCDGEAGRGIYAYPIRYGAKMRPYYQQNKDGVPRNIIRFVCRDGYVIDLTKKDIMSNLLAFAKERFARNKLQMKYYVIPKVNKTNIQVFGTIIEDFVREFYPDAAGYTVPHQCGSAMPMGKQTVITKLEKFNVEWI